MRVIVALDRTEFADQVVEAVCSRQWPIDTQFKLLTVLEPLQWQAESCIEWNDLAETVLKRRKHHADEILIESRQKLARTISKSLIHFEVRIGSAREEIITAATEWMADKIILGAHGHSPNRLLTGGVSHSVAQHAACSVELIRLKNSVNNQDTPEAEKVQAAIAK